MTHEQILDLLDDFVGGDLPPREEKDVRRHLMQCEGCRAEEQALRALLDEAAALPDEVVPERDLWVDIAPRLESRGSLVPERADPFPEVRVIGPRPARPLPWWMLAAASVALVATTSFATLQFSGRGADPTAAAIPAQTAQAPRAATPTALAAFRPAEQEYEKAISELEIVLRTQRGRMAPRTAATLEANLRIIDRAIQESRAALAADPNSAGLTRMLSDAYDTKLDVLRQAVSL
jgi:hypothetical protein